MPPTRALVPSMLVLVLRCSLLALAVALAAAENECCDVCIGHSDPNNAVISYDPVIHDQCSPAKGICCYGCEVSNVSPDYESGVTFNKDGDAEAEAGRRIRIKFVDGITRLTYNTLAEKQLRTSFVTNNSQPAERAGDEEGTFEICVGRAGRIRFRGWGVDSCQQTTPEYMITVVASKDPSVSCDSGNVHAPNTSGNRTINNLSSATSSDVENCNPTRGAVRKNPDGTEYCECLSEWGNPPGCDSSSWFRTTVTVLGAVATVMSIVFSVRAYIKSKKENADTES